ncbi:hypothetical protein LJR277_002515 [Pseudomonas sp. LjRoot277]|uniref:hypothetical protein n=1 Tax=Pseudomonas sp. LjRoot277 TaxID=3342307 RepID=UPI003ECEF804
MFKDRVVWVGCVALFFSGVVWGGLTINIDFLKISNLHDLFDIVGAVATSVAVYIAATWKKQLGSSRDYEHARKAAVVALKYKESVVDVWEASDNCLLQEKSGESMDDRMKKIVTFTVEARLDVAQKLRSEMQDLLVECRAIWRNGIDDDLSKAIAFEYSCSNCVKTYLMIINPSTNPVTAIAARFSLIKFRERAAETKLFTRADAEQYVERLFSPINDKLDAKMR